MKIEPLSHKTLEETITLVNTVFSYEALLNNLPERSLQASLDPQANQALLDEQGVNNVVYFVALDEATNQVLGVIGQYVKKTDLPGVVWIGWFCVDPAFRRHHVGETLLTWNMDNAREQGYTTMRLYTSDHPREAAAQRLYDRLGFAVTSVQPLVLSAVANVQPLEEQRYSLLYRERQL